MGYNRSNVKKLLTSAEYELFVSSLPSNVVAMDERQLRDQIDRCRRERDKYQGLYRRQARASGSKARGRGQAATMNLRTAQKASAFSEALARFEKQLAARQQDAPRVGDASPQVNRTTRRANRRGRKSTTERFSGGFMNEQAQAAFSRSSALAGPTAKHISAARAAAGRRTQARRDSQ